VSVRFAENAVERAIRQVALLAHGADNNTTTGPAFKAVFPDGLDAGFAPHRCIAGIGSRGLARAPRDPTRRDAAAAGIAATALR